MCFSSFLRGFANKSKLGRGSSAIIAFAALGHDTRYSWDLTADEHARIGVTI